MRAVPRKAVKVYFAILRVLQLRASQYFTIKTRKWLAVVSSLNTVCTEFRSWECPGHDVKQILFQLKGRSSRMGSER